MKKIWILYKRTEIACLVYPKKYVSCNQKFFLIERGLHVYYCIEYTKKMRMCVCITRKMFEFCICPEEWKVKTCWATYVLPYIFSGKWNGVRNSACLEYATAPHSYSEPMLASVSTVTHVHKKKYFSRCKYEIVQHLYVHAYLYITFWA